MILHLRPPRIMFCVLSALAFSGIAGVARVEAAVVADKVSFNRDIRPIFSDTCFQCHGPDEKHRKSGLRLDVRAEALKPAESGAIAIVPGKPEESEVLKRLMTKDPDDIMPPTKLHKTISPAQIDTVRKWIAQGAEYQGHWAFITPERPVVPKVTERTDGANGYSDWSANPIDGFILKRLAESGLTPSPEAAPETIARRMTLDLTGIPPTPDEVAAFVKEWNASAAPAGRQAAVGKLADRLLASPRYGEKMAIQWLDFARYADSHGFQTDSSRTMWPWRDWVIRAFNENKPFDQFTVEQLAGDLLPNPSRDQVVATGFNRNHRINGEGGIIDEEWFVENVIDRVETTGLTWMALTLNCSRCHDHKYDPISQREFYQLFSFFNSIEESGTIRGSSNRSGGNPDPVLRLPGAAEEGKLAQLRAAAASADAKVADLRKTVAQRRAAWEPKSREMLKAELAAWQPLAPTEVHSDGGATFTRLEDGSYLASGVNPPHDSYVITAPIAAGAFGGILLETFPDPSLPAQSLGRNSNGNYVLTDVDAEISAPSLAQPIVAAFSRAEADYEQKGYEVKLIVENKPQRKKGDKNRKGWAIDGPTKKLPRKAMFVTAAPVVVPAGATLKVTLRHDAIAAHNIGRFRISATALPGTLVTLGGAKFSPSLRAALEAEPSKRTPAQRTEVDKFFNENGDSEMKAAQTTAAAAKKAIEDFEATLPAVMVMRERAQPKDAFILTRGEYDKPAEKVVRAVPAALPALPPDAPVNRLGLARWLVSGQHPLTARVWVNRAWEKFFGTGLVKTTENLGSQADWPSHPELLDWLATEFVRLRWDMKAMQKLMVTSAAYRQSSKVTPELVQRDPENRLLARGPRFRLPAEIIRDQALAASGLLVERVGGPSVRPYMPDNIWDETSKYGDLRGYKADTGDGLYRRSLYTIWKRTASPPSMTLFDSPTREICTVKRSRTNTPLQALSLMNEVTFVEAARSLAQRMITEGGATAEQRIGWAFQRVTGRPASADEVKILAGGLAKRLGRYASKPDEAAKLGGFGQFKAEAKLNPVELAAYTLTANVLLNLDEVVTRE